MALLAVGFFGFGGNSLQERPGVCNPVLLPVALTYLLSAADEIPLYLKDCYPLSAESHCSDDQKPYYFKCFSWLFCTFPTLFEREPQ